MQVVLYMFRADGERKSFSIARDMTVMGRREDCDFRIPLGDISRKHCRIMKEEGTLKIEDLGSSNGTYINGKRIHESELQPGDTIQIGPVVFVLQVDGQPAEDELKPFKPEPIKKSKRKDSSHGDEETISVEDDAPVEASADGDFDPMSVLEGNVDSDIMPSLPDSAIKEDVMIDMSDSSSERDA